jgi:excisionase family DNA binding protein
MYYSTNEVALKLQCSKMTITRMVKKGVLKPINTQKNYFLFEAKQIDCLTFKTSMKCNK